MRCASFILAVAAALGPCGPSLAQGGAPDAGCAGGSKPVVSEGLPRRPCTAATGVVINRGPAVAPEPSEAQPAWAPPEPVRRRSAPRDPFGYDRSSTLVPVYPLLPRPRQDPSFRFVLRTDDVYLRIGDGRAAPWPRPRPRHHGRHDGGGRGDRGQPVEGAAWGRSR